MGLILTIVGTIITVISFGYAIYQSRQIKKLEKINIEQAWEFYRQSLRTILLIDQELEGNPNVKRSAGINQAAAMLQEMGMNSIKLIKRFSPSFTQKDIDVWKSQQKIENESQEKAFRKFL